MLDEHYNELNNNCEDLKFGLFYNVYCSVSENNLSLLKENISEFNNNQIVKLIRKSAVSKNSQDTFAYLWNNKFDILDESTITEVMGDLASNNQVKHFNLIKLPNIPVFRWVNIVNKAITCNSYESLKYLVENLDKSISSSALNFALKRSAAESANKYREVSKLLISNNNKEELPYVFSDVMQFYFNNYDIQTQASRFELINELILSVDASTFKKIYKEIHFLVKEHELMDIKSRYSKEKILNSIENIVAEKEINSVKKRKI